MMLRSKFFRISGLKHRYLFDTNYCTNREHNLVYHVEKLGNRSLLKVSGENCLDFLQGLTTNDTKQLSLGNPIIFTMFLNSKGRVLYDAMMYSTTNKNEFLIECDLLGTDELLKHMKRFCLRRKVNLSLAGNEFEIWSIINKPIMDKILHLNTSRPKSGGKKSSLDGRVFSEIVLPEEQYPELRNIMVGDKGIIVSDPRLPVLGKRAIIEKGVDIYKALEEKGACVVKSNSIYKHYRYMLGVAEGLEEMPSGECFPLEMNCDYLRGVSFHKGCYIGQELTARTFHTGVVRKRIMPIALETNTVQSKLLNCVIENPEEKRKLPLGKIKGVEGNIGLALMRVSEALTASCLRTSNAINVKVTRPFWWPIEISTSTETN